MANPSITFSQVSRFERKYVRPRAGRTLIAGSFVTESKKTVDRRTLYPDVLGVDMREGPGVDVVLDLETLHFDDVAAAELGKFAHIECLSVLEHSRRPWLMAANLEQLLEPGGTLYLSVPFVWRYHDYPGDLWRFTHEGVQELFPGIEWKALMYASNGLRPDHYLRAVDIAGHPHLPKCEVVGFGVRQ